MRVTAKGQVTIPRDVREELGIAPGTIVEITVQEDHAVLRKAPSAQTRGAEIVARLRGRATTRMTTDEILALTRGDE